MREHTTRLLAFVVLLLCVAAVSQESANTVTAASQREQSAVQVYFPFVPVQNQAATNDLMIVHMGLYQSVQNESNGVTLVAHKPAMLRVHAVTVYADREATFASVTVEVFRDGTRLGTLTQGPELVSSQPSEDELNSTFNFEIPTNWLEGKILISATIDRASGIPELDETNNFWKEEFEFRSVPPLELTLIPITYVDSVTGITFSESAQDPISEWLLSAYPISEIIVEQHDPYTFAGNLRLGEDWGRLLTELTTLWATEVGPGSSKIYYGLVPNRSAGGASWFAGGISGLGWIGQRVSVGLNVGTETGISAAHEIGHNLGRQHAPCGNPSGVDPHFPYPNASIGVFGVDTVDEILLDPDVTHDVMSYCGPEWVSDYTYEGLFQDQMLRGNRKGVNKGEGWLLRALIDDKGMIEPLPTLNIEQPIYPGVSSDYKIGLFDENGEIVGTYPAALYEAEEFDTSVQMLIAHIPSEDSRVVSAQFLHNGKVVAQQLIEDLKD